MSDVDAIKREIEDKKAALVSKLEVLESQAHELVSPANFIEEHPYLSMGIALGAGLVVGSQVKDGKKLLQPVAMGIFSVLVNELEKKYLPR